MIVYSKTCGAAKVMTHDKQCGSPSISLAFMYEAPDYPIISLSITSTEYARDLAEALLGAAQALEAVKVSL